MILLVNAAAKHRLKLREAPWASNIKFFNTPVRDNSLRKQILYYRFIQSQRFVSKHPEI